jgi:hypothetical protein
MFFLEGPGFSSPITLQNQVSQIWLTNVASFFQHLKEKGINNIIPTPSFMDVVQGEGPYNSVLLPASSFCGSTMVSLWFNRTSPYGFVPIENGYVPHGFQDTQAYRCSPANPNFVGWPLLVGPGGVLDGVLQKAQLAGLWVHAFDMQNEADVHHFTATARLMVDGITNTHVWSEMRNRMASRGFDPNRVVYSAAQVPPDGQYQPLTADPYPDVSVSNHPAAYFIDIMKQDHGIFRPGASPDYAGGCSTPGGFCPTNFVSRGEAAKLVIRFIYGNDDFPYQANPYFPIDVPSWHPYFQWIQKLRELGITSGCGPSAYCPDSIIDNGQFAVFTIRAWQVLERGSVDNSFTAAPSWQVYGDAPPWHPFYKWIQKTYDLRIMEYSPPECWGGWYCPESPVTRSKASYFLVRGIRQKFRNNAFRCFSVYGDDARYLQLSASTNALQGKPFGMPSDEGNILHQNCYPRRWPDESAYVMLPLVAPAQPSIIDPHIRPAVLGSMNEYTVFPESQQSFDSLYLFLRDNFQLPWPEVVIGESWNPRNQHCNNGSNGIVVQPNNATANTIGGFNLSWLAGVVWFTLTPWAQHTDVHGCEPFPTDPWLRPPIYPTLF